MINASIERDFENFGWLVRVREKVGSFKRFLRAELTWEMVEGHMHVGPKGIALPEGEAQEIATALLHAAIEAGLLPDQSKLQGELEATKKHLADLQKAFNTLLERTK